jgi:hypothetical protein
MILGIASSRLKIQDSRFKIQDSIFNIQYSRFNLQDLLAMQNCDYLCKLAALPIKFADLALPDRPLSSHL